MSEVTKINVYNDLAQEFSTLEVPIVVGDDGMVAFSAYGLSLALRELRGQKIVGEEELPDIRFNCGLEINTRMNTVGIDGILLPKQLTKNQFTLLKILAENSNTIISKEKITEIMWEGYASKHLVDVHLDTLRMALGARDGVQTEPGPNAGLFVVKRGFGVGMGPRAFERRPLIMPS